MAESITKSIERWEMAIRNTNAANVKPEIEKFIKMIGDNEDSRSNFTRRVYSGLIKGLSLENASSLVEILRYLAQNTPSYILSYFLPVLFNKTLELEKAKNYQLGKALESEFILNNYQIPEMKLENVDFIMSFVQQWIYFHYKGGLPANSSLKQIVEDNIKIALQVADSAKYLMILDKFLGKTPNLGPALGSLKGGASILKNTLKEILSFPMQLSETTQKSLNNVSVPKYVVTVLQLIQKDAKTFKTFDLEMLTKLETKLPKTRAMKFIKEFCKLNDTPSIEHLTAVNDVLLEILSVSKRLVSSSIMLESCLIVTKCIKAIVDALCESFDSDSLMILNKFTMNLIKILMHCDSEIDRGFCTECKNTKRHATAVLINILVSAFESFGKRMEVNLDLVAYCQQVFEYKLTTVEGLKCSYKDRMIEHTLTSIYCILSNEKMMGNPHYTKYKVKMAELFKKYSKDRKFKNLTPKHITHMYSQVYNLTEFPCKHLLVTALQILYETTHLTKKSRTDQLIKKRENVPELYYFSVLQILQKITEAEFNVDIPNYEPYEIILLEMEAIFVYSRNYVRNVGLFNKLCELSKDSVILGHALFLFEFVEHNKVDQKTVERIETELKKSTPKNMKTEMILGLITMRKYTNAYNRSKETLKDVKFFQTNTTEDNTENFEMLQVTLEKPLFKLLDEGLQHFQTALKISSRDNYKSLDDLYSCVKIRRSIDTLSVHYEQRGLYYQAMEAQYLSYTIAKAKQDDMGLIISLTHFVENMEQFKRLSKREPSVPKMTQELSDLLEKTLKGPNVALHKQGYIYSGYLSLVSYYIAEDSASKALDLLKWLQAPLHTCENKKYESYFKILRFKFYMLHQRLLLEYPSKMSSMVFLCLIMAELNDMVEYKDEFHVYMPNLLFKMIENLSWHQIARYDTKIIEAYAILVFKIAARKGLFLRCLQVYLSLTNMNLISENLNDVEIHLSHMDRMLGNEPTKISKKINTEVTPVRKKVTNVWLDSPNFSTDSLVGSAVRREAAHSPTPYLMSPPVDVPISEFAKYLPQHDWKCKCLYCSMPQVKAYAFVLGCFYARMLYLNANHTTAYKFYEKAIEYWMSLKNCILDNNDETLVKNFVTYSLYIHLHMCQCFMVLKKYNEIEQIGNSLKDLLDLNLCDNAATIEECNFTLTAMMTDLKKTVPKKFRSFESFVVDEDVQVELTPPNVSAKSFTNKIHATATKSTKSIPIFVDGPKMSPAQKKRLFFSKKKDTLDSPNVSEMSINLESIKRSAQKHSKPASTLKKTVSEIPKTTLKATTSTAVNTVKRSTRIQSKDSAKRPALPKKQLKFSPPTLSSPAVVESVAEVKQTPKSRKAPIKPKTITKSVSERSKVIVIDSDSDTSMIPPPSTLEQLAAGRAKRHKARTTSKN